MEHSIKTDDKYFWLPADRFILKLVERYGSLAMLRPRIQTPWDLIRWADMKSDLVKQYRFVYNIKKFYLEYMTKNDLMIRPDYKDPDLKHGALTDKTLVSANDITLMSHPPVFGHWLKESGFITPDLEKNDHELSYDEYMNIFTTNKEKIIKTRFRLYPTFEGLLVQEKRKIHKYKKASLYNGKHFEICSENVKDHMIYSPLEKANFDIKTGKYDDFYFDRMAMYDFKKYMGDDPYKIDKTIYSVYGIEKDGEVKPVSILFNDKSFNPLVDSNTGFLNTPIQIAYHTSFSLHSRFNIEYFKSSGDVDARIKTKVRKFEGSIEAPRFVNGRLISHEKTVEKSMIKDCGEYDEDPFDKDFEDLGLFPPSPVKSCTKIEAHPYYKTLKTSDEQDIIKDDQSCYSSFHDFYEYNSWIQEIMNTPMCNYFWFMYGSLPVNKIAYEDLMMGFTMRSKFVFTDESLAWNTQDKKFILEDNNPKELWYARNIVPDEHNVNEVIRINAQCIKFFGLIYELQHEHTLDEAFFRQKTYYISNSQNAIMEKEILYPVLKRAYPKIASLHDPKIEAKTVLEIKDHDTLLITSPTENKREDAIRIVQKYAFSDIVPFTKRDFEFLFAENLLNSKAKALYMALQPDNFAREKNPEKFDELVAEIKGAEIKGFLQKYISLPTKDPGDFNIPREITAIDTKLVNKFSNRTAASELPMDQEVEDIIKTITSIMYNNPTVISAKMLCYLFQWGFLPLESQIMELKYQIHKNTFSYITDLQDEKYKKILAELDRFNFSDRKVYEARSKSNIINSALADRFHLRDTGKQTGATGTTPSSQNVQWDRKIKDAIKNLGYTNYPNVNSKKSWEAITNKDEKHKIKIEAEKLAKEQNDKQGGGGGKPGSGKNKNKNKKKGG